MKLEHNGVYMAHARNSFIAVWDADEEVFIVPRYKCGYHDTVYELYVDVIRKLDEEVPAWQEPDDLAEFLHGCARKYHDEYDPCLEPVLKRAK